MTQTSCCVIVNRQTCGSGWKNWEAFLMHHEISYTLHHTYSISEAKEALAAFYAAGNLHYLFVGGDGTIHHGVNTLMELAGHRSGEITIGVLPCGTGNDWVRTYGTTKEKLAIHLKEEYTAPYNLVRITWPDGRTRYAANMVGGALDAAVVGNLKRASFKIPSWILYPYGLVRTLLKPHTWRGTLKVDRDTYTGDILTIQAGFAKYCGGGMYVLPHAREYSPGLLLMKPKKLISLLFQLHTLYNGKIASHKEATARHFEHIDISHSGIPIPIEADGEFLGTSPVRLEACYDAMKRIV
jgi:diacylglycerol kinase family enzyme